MFSSQEGSMRDLIARFVADDSGATAIEYGLIAAIADDLLYLSRAASTTHRR